jgi:hypothetical protein
MPGPQKTKGALQNTRYKSRMHRKNTTRKRKEAFYLHALNKAERDDFLKLVAEFTLYISQKLEREGKVKQVESCDGAFETYYDADDSLKILMEVSKKSTKPTEINRFAQREFRKVKRNTPGIKFNLKAILFFLMLTCTRQADAKWYELHAPPNEISAPDTLAAVVSGLGWGITALAAPPLAPLGVALITCGWGISSFGSAVRLHNNYTGVHLLPSGNKKAEMIGVIVPGYGQATRAIGSYFYPNDFTVRSQGYEGLLNTPAAGLATRVSRAHERFTGEPISEETQEGIRSSISGTFNNYVAPSMARYTNASQIASAASATGKVAEKVAPSTVASIKASAQQASNTLEHAGEKLVSSVFSKKVKG